MSIESEKNFYQGKRVWVTGHKGMLGSAVVRALQNEGATILLTDRKELDLTRQQAVTEWMEAQKPQLIFHVAAKVGGIFANATLPADFIRDNVLIETNVIDGAHRINAEKLIFVGSNCTYPNNLQRPIAEEDFLTGTLDNNIRAYAIGKIAGIEMCRAYRKQYQRDFISVIPPNLYGPGDNYHPEHSHVVAGIMRRAHEAKTSGASELVIWGDGSPRRELLHVDDLAQALKHLMTVEHKHDVYNIGQGRDLSIKEIAELIADIVGFNGKILYDPTKPNGTMQKLLDSSKANNTGWRAVVEDKAGLTQAYEDYKCKLSTQ